MQSIWNQPLSEDLCQQIIFEAIRNLFVQRIEDPFPDKVLEVRIKELSKTYGPNMYLFHPADSKELFDGVSLAIYKRIQTLFCSRIGRTTSMVAKIINRTQIEKGLPPVNEIAIWAMCGSMYRKREESMDVSKSYVDTNWVLEKVDWKVSVVDANGEIYNPSAVIVSDLAGNKIIAVQICKNNEIESAIVLAVYEAIIANRYGSRDGVAGVIWKLPIRLSTSVNLNSKVESFLEMIGVATTQYQPIGFVKDISDVWEADLLDRVIPEQKLSLILDNYLYRKFNYAPMLTKKDMDHSSRGLMGYSRDPLWQFPALRILFDKVSAVVGKNGMIAVGRWVYQDELLNLWTEQSVDILVSPSDAHSAWVFDLTGEVICQALAI